MKTRIIDAARVVRSKNAGPYELTFDIIFKGRAEFEECRAGGAVNAALVSRLYGISESDVLGVLWFEPANAVKITIKRPRPSGTAGETDIYGAQQHAPLLGIEY